MTQETPPHEMDDLTTDALNSAEIVRKVIEVLKQEDLAVSRPGFTLGNLRPDPKTDDSATALQPAESTAVVVSQDPPWTLQQFFNGEIDLDVELSKRFPTMPMMALISFRTLGTTTGRRVATLTTQDGAAALILDADLRTKEIQLSFTLGSMLTLRFTLDTLSEMDRTRWLDLMRREQGGLAFLWGQNRWESDYLICISRKHHTNFFAFSPNRFEAGIRLTSTATRQLLDWLNEVWSADPQQKDDVPPLLTW